MGILPDGQGKDFPYVLMKVNFNLKKGKEVMLAYAGNGIKERVAIPDLGMEQGIYKKNRITGIWREEREEADGTGIQE